MKIAILAPAFPPLENALGDYTILLGAALANKGFDITYIAPAAAHAAIYPDSIKQCGKKKKDLASQLRRLEINYLLVNYSGYGYQQKGMPFWLIKSLQEVKKTGIQVAIIFHELYASSKQITSLLFYTTHIQKKIYQSIAQLASHIYCTNERMLRIIQDELPLLKNRMEYLPLFSNIPTLTQRPDSSTRKHYAIVFGTIGRRNAVYINAKQIEQFCKTFKIEKIVDIGEGNAIIPSMEIKIERLGRLPDYAVAEYLQNALVGLIDYRNDLLAKSGIFAAYAGNGLAIINTNQKTYANYDYLHCGKQYNNINAKNVDFDDLSNAAFEWYQNRTVDKAAALIAKNCEA